MECSGCTLCCELLDIPWMGSPAGHTCIECKVNEGCKLYDNIPKDCMDFQCAYTQMEKVSINLRPDKCGVIFERISDDMFFGTTGNEFIMNKDVEGQIKTLNSQGFSVILSNPKHEINIFKIEKHSKEYIKKEFNEVISKWQHRHIHTI